MRTFGCLLIALLAGVHTASAAPFTWTVAGNITSLNNPSAAAAAGFGGAFAVGQSFVWTIAMDSAAPDHNSDPACGLYFPITGMTFASGPLNYAINTAPGQDYIINAGSNACDIPSQLGRIRADFGTNLFLSMHISSLFATDALPVSVEGVHAIAMDFLVGGPGAPFGTGIASARVTSLTSSVPEPTGLLVLGLLVACRRRRIQDIPRITPSRH